MLLNYEFISENSYLKKQPTLFDLRLASRGLMATIQSKSI
ncbi:hypothetical protein CKA32_000415 [Geitlerinema sp. FC II]|nr:hypothetical protein CKA32_000415 [Geitlerinema sp. FC II]